ncbi:MAG: hypothetical protein ACM3US_15475 [Sphingomonadaceae bacterium]
MGKLRILSIKGDRTVTWDRKRAAEGDPEAQEAVREAERIFREALRNGATAFRLESGAPATRLDRFDPEADQVVVVPRVAGG